MHNDWELESKINKVEELREKIRHDDRCMEIYNDLKELNYNDRLYGWMFSSDDILDEDLVDFAESYQKPYVLDVLQVYANELENILIKSRL